ncbi:carboxypeptidase regulatory-like domain-containing protein [Candidatus Woesearchaeota archaeon]|nr:carboxypeptidase regulatory-like domain-containing protein [Candidatus Woesearchaeota archaeon]
MRTPKRGLALASALSFLVIFLSVFIPAVSAQETNPTQAKGCYFYSQGSLDVSCKTGGVTEEVAQEDCAAHSGCVLPNWFKAGSTCADIPECKVVACDAAKYACQEVPLGTCVQAGGKEITAENKAAECTKGCCVVPLPGGPFCAPELVFKSTCAEIAASKQGTASYKFYNPDSMTLALCQQQYCKAAVAEGSLIGIVKDPTGQAIAGATISILGTVSSTQTSATGSYSLLQLVPATYSVKVSKAGYMEVIKSVSVSAGDATTFDFQLQPAAGASSLRVTVRDTVQKLLPGITVTWKGPVQGTTKTDSQGTALVSNIPAGEYTLLVSAVGYVSQEQKRVIGAGETVVDVTLLNAVFQGVQGTTFVNGEKTYGVSIYVDGFFKAKSQYPDGKYSVSLPADGKEHTVSATYQSFVSSIETVAVAKEQTIQKDLYLVSLKGECAVDGPSPQKNVQVFTASSVLGEKKVRLVWEKPCPEVASYTLQKSRGETLLATNTISGLETIYVDDKELMWKETYSYTLVAHFDSGLSSENAVTATITLGDEECEGRFVDATSTWSSFCLVNERQTVYTCTNQNILTPAQTCSSLGTTWYCAQTTGTTASCKDAGICSVNTAPFGLYAVEDVCYGQDDEKFCYYDYTKNTIANQCASCATVTSCFDYRSRGACEKNNCVSSQCAWVDVASNPPLVDYSYLFSSDIYSPLVTSTETGAGYCVEKEYDSDEKCSLCSSSSSLFENYFCTPNVCSSLGRCFANPEQTSCEQCKESPAPDATCYRYTSETECVGKGGITKDEFGRLSFSGDRCSWGRCSWDGASCIKDGNADKKDDCALVKGSSVACAVDNTPPTTTMSGALVTTQSPLVTFTADDSSAKAGQTNPLKTLSYCLSSIGGPNVCTADQFVSVEFKGLTPTESIPFNISQFPTLGGAKPEGNIFTIYFYSEDVFSNREQIQEGVLYIDTVSPQFTVVEEVATTGTVSQLNVHLEEVNEPISCTFSLQQVLPLGAVQTTTVPLEVLDKKALFSDLKGIKYELTTTCTDKHNNINTVTEAYSFDLEPNINIISPSKNEVVVKTSVLFKVETTIGSTCVLYDAATNQKIADFVTDEDGFNHGTEPISLAERKYVAEQKVVCTELLTGKTYEDYFDFTVDTSPPSVMIELQEDSRVVQHKDTGWKESFITSANVHLACSLNGLACQQIYYCLGEACTPADLSVFKSYTSSFVVEQSTKICYYATREGEQLYNNISCGFIGIDGFGITLDLPPSFTYNDEVWGVSASPTFDWQFFTKVPTQECKFDFISSFTYDALAKYKWKEKNSGEKYLFGSFPEGVFSSFNPNGGIKTVYVACKDGTGEVSPIQKMNLEYDPTPPEIKTVSSSPDPVIEGINTLLSVSTDDKTTCVFINVENGKTYSFPGKEEHVLDTTHETLFYVDDFIGDKKEYVLSVMCENGAGLKSAVQNLTISVDYTQKGSITSIYPQKAFVQNGPLSAEVITSKSGYCEHKIGEGYLLFSETNGNVHKTILNGTGEGAYTLPFRCFFGDTEQTGEFSYTIDKQPPIIESIDDGIVTCGKDEWAVLVKTNESALANYSYSVYAATGSTILTGNKTSFSKSDLLLESSAGPDSSLVVPLSSFIPSSQNTTTGFIISIKAIDAAGNIGPVKDSDGVIVSNSSHPTCLKDSKLPSVTFSTVDSTSCSSRLVSMSCGDDTGCQNYLYGVGTTVDSCIPLKQYNGKNIEITSTSYLCYATKDAVGQNKSSATQVIFEDKDSDGVADTCDSCPETLAGKIADSQGCAEGQVTLLQGEIDSDGDGLPDAWEEQFNSLTCQLSSVSKDSDGNSISDGLEDYDSDGKNNYEEYTSGKNPCVAEVSISQDEKPAVPVSFPTPSFSTAWVLLILGIIFSFGGFGYLLYSYLASGKRTTSGPQRELPAIKLAAAARTPSTAPQFGLGDQFAAWKRARAERVKEKEKQSIFGEFGKGKSLVSLQDLAQKYVEHKEEIRPQLHAQEKGVFDKLESIAQQTKRKDISDVVSKDEAQDIFEKLRQISKKKKKGD